MSDMDENSILFSDTLAVHHLGELEPDALDS